MSGYDDDYKDQQSRKFIERWCPNLPEKADVTAENLQWNIARARSAEAERDRMKAAWAQLKDAMK